MASLRPAHRIDFEEFCRLYKTGVLDPDSRVELIDGVIIDMELGGIDHYWAVDRLSAIFHRSFGDTVAIRTQGALSMELHIQRAREGDEPPHVQTLSLKRSTKHPLHALPGVQVDLSSLLDL